MSGLIVDNFAGGGGASTGIEQALGRAVDIAINHDEEAIRMHEVNHPGTRHIRNNIWKVDPLAVTEGKPVELAWFSPDCKHFSKAKGGKPREKSIRDLAWIVVLWAQRVKPQLILIENVEEFRTWGPLGFDGQPIKERAGETFDKWCRSLRKAGYKLQFRELRACDYGAPTIRKRFFMIARRDGLPIVWPEPTHGRPDSPEVLSGKRLPWRTAAEIIDWSIPCPSIFERKKPLAEATCRRIARGIVRYVLENPKPFIVRVAHGERDASGKKRGRGEHPIDEPLPTVLASPEFAVVTPHITKFRSGATGHAIDEPLATVTANSFIKRPGGSGPLGLVSACLIHRGNGERQGQAPRCMDAEAPFGTVVAGGTKHALVTAFLAQYNNDRGVSEHPGKPLDDPLSVVTTKGPHQALVTSNLVKLRGTCADGQAVDEPLHTVSAGGSHFAEVRAFLLKYYGNEEEGHDPNGPLGTVTTRDRFGLVIVTVEGEEWAIIDIGMRMLTKREQFNAQGFPFWSRNYRMNLWRDPIILPVDGHEFATAKIDPAKSAEPHSSSSSTRGPSELAAVHALIDLGRQVLQLSSPKSCASDAPSAGESVCVPLPIEIVSAAQTLAPSNGDGASEPIHFERPSASASTPAMLGGSSVGEFGDATTRPADDAVRVTVTEIADTKSITSPVGPSSRTSASTLIILSCFVVDAIASSTLAPTQTGNSFVELEVRHHYIIDRDAEGRRITETAQQAKCGNSVCPPLARALVAANAVSAIVEDPESEAA